MIAVRLASKIANKLQERAVMSYIKQHPFCRLYEINDATLKSHHSWATKSVLVRLEHKGKIHVCRESFKPDGTTRKIKPLYSVYN